MLDITKPTDVCAVMAGTSRIWPALVVTIAFTAVARCIRGVSRSGALAGALVCLLLYLYAGPGAIAALLSVFILAWVTRRFGSSRKLQLRSAEKRDSGRPSQLFANLRVSFGC